MVFSINAPTSGAETFTAFQASAKKVAIPSGANPSATPSGQPDADGAALALVARTWVGAAVAAAIVFAL
jgi:hypothetical protein